MPEQEREVTLTVTARGATEDALLEDAREKFKQVIDSGEFFMAASFDDLGEDETHEGPYCRECGEPMFIQRPEMTAHHFDADSPDRIDHDADADHVAIPEEED